MTKHNIIITIQSISFVCACITTKIEVTAEKFLQIGKVLKLLNTKILLLVTYRFSSLVLTPMTR